ncbi:MAG: LLM class F420-dependent oxidoreductase [Rhodospirillaceae bacterium]|jgi:probable F420-dependent oxidoreductase|nr:LLM class F420-dependent oxidoreductase [Rhodospirillaceae bacterium]MBT3491465.1 LLM class F420-dependent oxidoreductase [Rhodospirillaceae bacterium]MBT3781426.1 LLM class F420-dependent oxidoreductase [Rhodospirillaceae bacterium]MBT3978839.1 LLM class F420-dependent oxidoreductase [Rhodospirillaceae bacterium]MBT4170971.1 LLM class F420-dependent oxidoreductase [Rhodospirillaceae bacterium]
MEAGVFLALNETTQPELIAQAARAIEERGFQAIWVPEHVVLFEDYDSKYPYSPDGRIGGYGKGMMEPFTALTFLAAHTSSVRLGTAICLITQRNPIYTAKQVADLDFLSGGRVNLGIGLGWLQEEFKALQVPFEKRGKRANEHIEVMKALWCEETSSYHGELYELPDCVMYPKPVQTPHPPIFVGGEGDHSLRRVADLCQGWLGASVEPEAMAERIATLHGMLDERGRAKDEVKIYTLPNLRPDADRCRRLEDVGVEQVIHMVRLREIGETEAALDKYARIAFG